jgi:hypothetical protein
MQMIKFILDHPDYFLLLMLCFFLVIKVIFNIITDERGDHGDDDEGGIGEPELDLPPGVTLPDNDLVKETQLD